MAKYMTRVSKDEFEALTAFHPGEVRYYVDLTKVTHRRKGAKIAVTRKPKAPRKKKAKKAELKAKVARKGGNMPVQLTVTRVEFKPDSISKRVQRLVRIKLKDDPTEVIGRSDLVKSVVDTSIFTDAQVNPVVSNLLLKGELRYTGAPA